MDGVIVVNKPQGITSSDVCLRVKKHLGVRKAGHAGTLDPMATGVLPLCINEATKLVQFIMTGEKEYVGTLRLGIETDTQDCQGKILKETEDIPRDHARVRETIHAFTGEMLQMPPMFSALKRNGVPLYKIARKGESVPREQRKISIYASEVLAIDIPYVTFRVACSHGTYVRTLCHDIGQRLACGAHLTELVRIRNGAFLLQSAVPLDVLESSGREEIIKKHLISLSDALKRLPAVVVDEVMERKIRSGASITLHDINSLDLPGVDKGQQLKVLSFRGSLIGVVETLVHEGRNLFGDLQMQAWKTLRVFQ
ncbi:MAG: tRNA pseudouridine(55) synthase TruB [Pseudomonadota bacterium]